MKRLALLFHRYFRYTAAVILLGTALVKFIAIGIGITSTRPDPVFQILSETDLALIVGAIEMICATLLLLPKIKRQTQMKYLLWLVLAFVTYRWFAANRGSGCRCFAGLFDHWNIASKYSGNLAVALLTYLGLGGLLGFGLTTFNRFHNLIHSTSNKGDTL